MDFFEYISKWINENPGKALGAFSGFILGIFILTFGPLKTLLIIIFTMIGYIIGKIGDEDLSIFERIKGIFKKDR